MKKNQNGFSPIEIILVIVFVGLVGGIGWYVWNNNKTNTNNETATSQPATSTVVADTTAKYNGSELAITFSYPKSWTVDTYNSEPTTCTGNRRLTVIPAESDIAQVATTVGKPELKVLYLDINQFGTASSNCAKDGVDFSATGLKFAKSAAQLTKGALKDKHITFYSHANTAPDSFVVTNSSYDTAKISEYGTVKIRDKTFQIRLTADSGKYKQNIDPVTFDITKFQTTQFYKDLVNLLESVN